jgi:arsenate reductase
MTDIQVYGLKNCDTCKKARAWLDQRDIGHVFHDVREAPLDRKTVAAWIDELGSDTLINRRGTTWRQLSAADQAKAADAAGACDLILAHPALMKRPVFDLGRERLVGFGKPQQAVLAAL